MGKKKMIENYQLLEVVGEIEDMYEIIKAKHVEERKYYTLKKVKVKNDKNNRLFEGFLNEASLLKNIKHPNFAKSIKMMKTASSIYVVYDYCEGVNLLEWMQKGPKKSITQKQGIIKQLCIVLAEMKKVGITHLYLNPQCVFISEDGDVKVTDFMYGTHMPDDTDEEIQLQFKVPKTDFTAPEVKKGSACFESDLYSFGKLVQFFDIGTSKKGTLSTKQFNTKCQEYEQIVKKTTKKKPYERDSLDGIYKLLFKTKGKLRKMQSMSMSLSKIGGVKQSMLSRSSQISTATGRQKSQFTQDLILKILKRRNVSRLLIDIFKNIVDVRYQKSADLLILVTLLLKKSTIIMNSIGKFMKYGKGIPNLQLNQKQRNKFFKSGDYFKLQPLIDNEVKIQKKQFQLALESIYLDNVKILQNKRFNQQLKKQELDQNYLRELMKDFIANSIQDMNLQDEHTNFLKSLYIMGMVLDNAGFEIFFEKKVASFPIDLNEQPIFIKIHKDMKVHDFILELQKYKKTGNA